MATLQRSDAIKDVAQTFAGHHSSLEILMVNGPPRCFPVILPFVPALSALVNLLIAFLPITQDSLEAAQAVVNLLQNDLPPLNVQVSTAGIGEAATLETCRLFVKAWRAQAVCCEVSVAGYHYELSMVLMSCPSKSLRRR